MIKGKFNVVTDGAWGSCGKGLIASGLADKYRPDVISTTNMANAGHTAVDADGAKFIAKAIPSPAALSKWRKAYNPKIVIGATSAFHLSQMLKEIEECGLADDQVIIHPRAGIITNTHREAEADAKTGTKHIASTMQGCGTFMADKIMRRQNLMLAKDYKELDKFVFSPDDAAQSIPQMLMKILENDGTVMHEGSQGFSLDISHGSHYPHCTSRSTTAPQNIADIGLPTQMMGDIYLVIRPYPIRVGNVLEDDKVVGYSGDCYDDHRETTWEQVAKESGAPPEVMAGELTTVTKRLRRVFTFSEKQLKEAVLVNGATKIALNFANYIDWDCYGCDMFSQLPSKVHEFVERIESVAKIPVGVVGTGPQVNHICYRDVSENSDVS